MLRKNSMFLRVLISVICVLLLQTVLVTLVLFTNGTMDTLENNAISSLTRNVENRRNTLEQAMVNNWSNLDKLEADIQEGIKNYLDKNGKIADDIFSGNANEQKSIQRNILRETADSLLSSLRLTMTTGTFMYFANPDIVLDAEDTVTLDGVYFRDLDPYSTPGNYSDVQYLIGIEDIKEEFNLERDNLRSITFSFTPGDGEKWNSLTAPFESALKNPSLSTKNLSYWSRPYTINDPTIDSNTCITYNRPLFYEGKLIGMIGTDVLIGFLDTFMPDYDFGNGKAGYMLVRYDANSNFDKMIACDIYSINGVFIKRAFGHSSTIEVTNKQNTIYTTSADGEKAHLSLQNLKIYNSNTPFSNNQLALIGIVVDTDLFATISTLQSGLIVSTTISLLAGIILLAFIIRVTTHPLIELAGQIKRSDPDAPLVMTKSKIYEIVLLNSTINAMKDKRKVIEEELREERERYLIALESAADTFLEYDLLNDELIIYHFTNSNQKSSLDSQVMMNFSHLVKEGDICPTANIDELNSFIIGANKDPIEIPLSPTLFNHIKDPITDGGYYWFLLKSSCIYDNQGKIKKVICIAKLITEDKVKEKELYESTLRDMTTQLYNENAGLSLINQAVSNLLEGETYSLSILYLANYGLYEAYYGRVFAAALLRSVSKVFALVKGEKDIYVRLDNDKFLLYHHNVSRGDVSGIFRKIKQYIAKIYMGENKEIRPDANLAIALGTDLSFDETYFRVNQTLQYALKNKLETCYYEDIPRTKLPKDLAMRPNPIDTVVNISRDNIVGFTFDIFEKTTDNKSVIKLLLGIIGEMFNLQQVIICSYNHDFGTMQVNHQWNEENETPYHMNIEKINADDFLGLQLLMDENGTLVCNKEELTAPCQKMLCILPEEKGSAFVCMTYENMVCNGAIIFKAKSPEFTLDSFERNSLFEIAKIISARISIDNSHSASKAKSEFLSRISHEIRTPMNAIIGMTNIAKDAKDNPQKLVDALNKIDFSSRHLLSLINDVLDMSKIESGKLRITTEPFALDTLIDSATILMRSQIESKQIDLVINKNYQHRNVIGDEYHIRQVLVNFLSNACKFTDKFGKIIFSLEEVKSDSNYGYFRFSVRDSGIGISKEDQARIFLAFEQGSSQDSKVGRQQGTGLGLTISNSIVNIMGSKIEVNSEVGEGSEFFFVLKLEIDKTARDEATNAAQKLDTDLLNGKRILLVEDNEINVEVALFLLKDLGAVIEVARNGKEAVDKFFSADSNYFDIILMDIQMPIMDGLQATREIRKSTLRKDAKTIPIIAMTANAFDEDMKKSIESGMNGHVAKPIEIDKLMFALKQIFNNKK